MCDEAKILMIEYFCNRCVCYSQRPRFLTRESNYGKSFISDRNEIGQDPLRILQYVFILQWYSTSTQRAYYSILREGPSLRGAPSVPPFSISFS
jgi:hypothetical protein